MSRERAPRSRRRATHGSSSRFTTRHVLLVAFGLACASCASPPDAIYVQPADTVWYAGAGPAAGAGGSYGITDFGGSLNEGFPWPPHLHPYHLSALEKLHPQLRQLVASPAPGESADVVVKLQMPPDSPRIPIELQQPSADSAFKVVANDSADAILSRRTIRRLPAYTSRITQLLNLSGGRLLRSYEYASAALVRVAVDTLLDLAGWDGITDVQPRFVRLAPPNCTGVPVPAHPVSQARTPLGFDAFRTRGLMGGRMTLLDTGVDPGHEYLSVLPTTEPSMAAQPALILGDCIDAPGCDGTAPGDAVPVDGHGTPCAGILVGRGSYLAPEGMGITDARLYSARVWEQRLVMANSTALAMYFDSDAYLAALDLARRVGASVVAANVNDPSAPEGTISDEANEACENGIVVVAAIGNEGAITNPEPSGPDSPGQARGVLGIGASPVGSTPGSTEETQSFGVVDSRQKPDLQEPTGTWSSAARSACNLTPLGTTSGATPYAAGLALGLRNLLLRTSATVDAGQVYAAMLACGEDLRATGGDFPADRGVGVVRLPLEGKLWWGRVKLKSNGQANIAIHLQPGVHKRLRVALWWMDPAPIDLPLNVQIGRHRDFDLTVLAPSNTVLGTSSGVPGVFERVDAMLPVFNSGLHRVMIDAREVGLTKQAVYWFAWASP